MPSTPAAVDENLVFMYKCLKTSTGKIDYHALAAETGMNIGAARKRFSRLKEKIENSVAYGASGGQTTKQPSTSKGSAASKRKFEPVDSSTNPKAAAVKTQDHTDMAVKEEAAVKEEVPKRQTRGRKIDFNKWFDNHSSAPGSAEDSEGEYLLDASEVKQDEEEDAMEVKDLDQARPSAKRVKKTMPTSAKGPESPTPMPRMDRKKTATAPLRPTTVVKATAKCSMHPSDMPIPSIERSPPSSPAIGAQPAKNYARTNADINLKSIQPGTFIALPAKRQQPVSPLMSSGPSAAQESFVTAGPGPGSMSVPSSRTSSQDSVGRTLQRELNEVDMIRPEDSISMVGREATPTSPGQSKFQRFRVLLTPWKNT